MIEAARRGDRQAQAALLRQLQDVWFRVCVGLLGGAEDARDATQETALRFVRELPRFRGDSSITTWSLGIALNVSREMRRNTPATIPLPQDDAAPSPLAGTSRLEDSPHERAFQEESRSMLRAVMQQLPPRQREALILRFFEDLSIQDTAAAMGCAPGTVKATVHQALRSLKGKLKELI